MANYFMFLQKFLQALWTRMDSNCDFRYKNSNLLRSSSSDFCFMLVGLCGYLLGSGNTRTTFGSVMGQLLPSLAGIGSRYVEIFGLNVQNDRKRSFAIMKTISYMKTIKRNGQLPRYMWTSAYTTRLHTSNNPCLNTQRKQKVQLSSVKFYLPCPFGEIQ